MLPAGNIMSDTELLHRVPHTFVEDIYGIATGCLVLALGLQVLHAAGLITGGVAGLALMLSYLLPIAPGRLFTLINLPIFLAFWPRLGTAYIARTTLATLGVTWLMQVVAADFVITHISRPMAAILGGTALGVGILAVTRHATGVGGLAVVARWLSQSSGWNFGKICMAIDAVIVTAAFVTLGLERGFWSLVAALATNAMVLVWHRPDRYIAQ
jgi:uncharacterized membrane-anchored protein YitT (DUF2179 family)